MHFWQLILLLLFATIAAYLLMSLAYSLVSLAFQIPFSNTGPHPDTQPANQPGRVRQSHIRGLLDAKLGRHVRTRSGE